MFRTTLEFDAAFARGYDMTLRVSSIPEEYPLQGPVDFRASALQALFDYGSQCAQGGRLWTSPNRRSTGASARFNAVCGAVGDRTFDRQNAMPQDKDYALGRGQQ
jgi:hypothetical protein